MSRPLRVAGWEVDITHLNPPIGLSGDAMAGYARVDLGESPGDCRILEPLTSAQARKLAAALLRKADELDAYRGGAAARAKAARQGALEVGSLWLLSDRKSPEVTELRLLRETKRTLKFEMVKSGNTVAFHEKSKALASGLLVPKAVPASHGGRP